MQVQVSDDQPVIYPAVCFTHGICHSGVLSVLLSHYDIVNGALWSSGKASDSRSCVSQLAASTPGTNKRCVLEQDTLSTLLSTGIYP